jgi:cell wall-associated NlpC family hydrolase
LTTRILFPRLLMACCALFLASNVIAQSSETEIQPGTTINANGATKLETLPTAEDLRPRVIGSVPAKNKWVAPAPALVLTSPLDKSLLTAIESHLGATYHFTGTGPNSFDCSGFVWRSYQEAGVDFMRGPARSYWATFAAPPKDEQFKFGTLVFFSGLAHVGIVADDKGFYHSSRHHGVVYSPFNAYWLSRIDGFRRVPLDIAPPVTAAKSQRTKPAVSTTAVEER